MKLWMVQVAVSLIGLALIAPEMVPKLTELAAGGNPEASLNGMTVIGGILFFAGIALGRFKKKDNRPFQLTKKMADVGASEHDHEFSRDDFSSSSDED